MLYIILILWSFATAFLGYAYCKRTVQVIQKKVDEQCYQELTNLNNQKEKLEQSIQYLNKEKDTAKDTLIQMKDQADTAAEIFYKEKMALARANIAADIEREEQHYDQEKEKYKKEYLQVISDLKEEFQSIMSAGTADISQFNEQKDALQQLLIDLQNKVDSAVEASKRANLEKTEKDFYRCMISDEDKEEIQKIRSIESYLRDKEPLNKVIWKVYYQKPYTDLIGRIIGKNDKTGIYKITNLEDQKCYVGQAISIKDRWSQHIKRGIGADTPTRNKLYPAMLTSGVENFMFEVLEECLPEQLNEKEKYWISYYHAQDYGYNENAGGSAKR